MMADEFYSKVTNQNMQTVDDDIYKSIIGEYHELPSVAPEFRQIPKHFLIRYSAPFKDLDMEQYMLSKEKEMFYLKIMFVGLVLLGYSLIY